MALINCPDCKRSVSDAAAHCLGCGAPIAGAGEVSATGTTLTTTQLTSKRIKLHTVASILVTILGYAIMREWMPGLGSLIFAFGVAWFITTRIRAWWHHG